MAFRNPPISGSYLVRPAIQSPNYVLGSSGWTVNRDGSVEFNSGTFRGSLNIGSTPGQHVIIGNGPSGDALDIYNLSNTLVYNISNQGAATSYNPSNTNFSVTTQNAEVSYGGLQGSANSFYSEPSPFVGTSQINQTITQVVPGRGQNYTLTAYGGSGDNTQPPTLVGTERNITGSVVQSDRIAADNLMHVAGYTITTDGSGNATWNHGCSFTPMVGFLASDSVGGADFYEYVWLGSAFTSSTASAHFNDKSGNNKVSTTFFAFGLFFG